MIKLILSIVLLSSTAMAETRVVTIEDSNSATMSTRFDDRSVEKVLNKIYKIDRSLPKGEPIYLVLNTPGGSVISGLRMFDAINALDREVHTITMKSISMGFHTVQALGKRLITPSGVMMSHPISGGTKGTMGIQESRTSFWVRVSKAMDTTVVNRTNGKWSLEKYKQTIISEYWAFGKEAVEDGFADEVVLAKCGKSIKIKNCPFIPKPRKRARRVREVKKTKKRKVIKHDY